MLLLAVDLQGRWNRYEQELAAASEQQVLSMEQGKASRQQIFSRWGAEVLVMCVQRLCMLLLWACGCCYLLTGSTGAAAVGLLIRAVG